MTHNERFLLSQPFTKMTNSKDTVFFAHSMQKDPPSWSSVSDADVVSFFEKLLKKRWQVISGKVAEARAIDDKVADAVSDSKAIISLFTRRHKVEDGPDSYLTSPWLLCECAFALGLFRHHDLHVVAGFREKGIEPSTLGMISVGGMEFPEFDRDYLERDKLKFMHYLDDLEKRIKSGPSGQSVIDFDTYKQVSLNKIYLVYRNGFGTIQNIVDIVIKDADEFMREGKIYHRIWTHFGEIPPLSQMLRVPVHKRKNDAFFHGILDTHRGKRLQTHLDITEENHTDSSCTFSVRFLDENRQPLKVKVNDTIQYQYAWGLPEMFPVNEEDLPSIVGDKIDYKTYCLAELDANHGKIERARLEVRFEREARDGQTRELFSKSPIVRIGRGPLKDTVWGEPYPAKIQTGEPDEFNMWYERYVVFQREFFKRISVAWRPSSKRYQL